MRALSNNMGDAENYRWLLPRPFSLSLSLCVFLSFSGLPNLLPPCRSSVLNYLLTLANLLAAELWSALNELLREYHKLQYSALSCAM